MSYFCCEEFDKQARGHQAWAGGGFIYPASFRPSTQFERDDKDSALWDCNGCCGGGCFVVTGMRYCPYCGTHLEKFKDLIMPFPLPDRKFETLDAEEQAFIRRTILAQPPFVSGQTPIRRKNSKPR